MLTLVFRTSGLMKCNQMVQSMNVNVQDRDRDTSGVDTHCLCHWIVQIMMRLSKSLKTGCNQTADALNKAPGEPAERERRLHELTHLPFRS